MSEIVNTTLQNGINNFVAGLYNGFFNLKGGTPSFIFNETGFLYAFLGALILFSLMMIFLLIIPTIINLYNQHKLAEEGELEPLIEQQLQLQSQRSMNSIVLPMENNKPLIMDDRLAWYWRYALLLVILLNVALFASSTVSVASSVYVYLTVGASITRLPSIYSFMIVSSVIEMWEAGVWPLSLLIGITSGIWPYVKLIIMFFCMLIPPKFLSKKWRKRVLRVLDVLGKWSLIDVYVLVLFIEAFRVHIELADNIFFDMAVKPEYAFFAYLLATVISLTLTHVMIYVHDSLEEPEIPENGKMELLCNHKFHRGNERFFATLFGKLVIPTIILLTAGLAIGGSLVDAFELNWEGSLIGDLLATHGGAESKDYSVTSLLMDIPNTSFDQSTGAGIRTIQVAYSLFVLVIPLMFIVSLAVIWVIPLTMQLQKAAFLAVEIFSAWAAMDVFIVALIVALLELEQFAAFIISDKCDGIDDFLAKINPESPSTCFTVKATLKSGSWILVVAVIILFSVGYTIMYICNKAIHERRDKAIDHYQKKGSVSDLYIPDNSVSRVTLGITTVLQKLLCIRLI